MTAPLLEQFATLRRCGSCASVLRDGEPCDRCGTVRTPPIEEWPKLVVMWVCWQSIRSKLVPYRSVQATWELLAADAIRMAGGQHANPYGSHITNSTPLIELWPVIVEQAARWKEQGYPTDPARFVLPAPPEPTDQ